MSGQSLQILVLSYFRPGDANVIRDFLFSFNAYSRHRYYYVFDCTTLEDTVDFSRFDVILVFWSLSENELSPAVRQRMRAARALKVAFLQDEYRDVLQRNEAMRQFGVNVIFTCVAGRDHDTFYSRSRLDTLDATYSVLTGYVPAYLEGVRLTDDPRPLDVSYRSRVVPFHLGDLGREKLTIAERFRDICQAHQLRGDISVRESDRIYGRAWPRFLRRSRCVLGTTSGASVVDFSGRIREQCDLYRSTHPDASYEEVKALAFADLDGKLVIETISPRAFEAAALGCTLVHHEGEYAGVLEPDRHYIRIKRDYSNVAEVVDRIRDHAYCRAMAAAAHRDLVASGRYSYKRFAQEFDARLDRHGRVTVTVPPPSRAAFYARRQRWGRQSIIPVKAGYIAGPVTTIAPGLAAALRARIALGRENSVALRFLLDPMRGLRVSRAAWQTLATTPVLRALLRIYLRTPEARAGATMLGLAEDLLRIDAVRRVRGGIPPSMPFGVELEFDAPNGALLLKGTVAPDRPRFGINPLPAEVDAALAAGRVRSIIWSCTLTVNGAPWQQPPAPARVSLGLGTRRFDSLTALCARAPGAAQALRDILSGEPSPRERRQITAQAS